jgi:hypothetical protein
LEALANKITALIIYKLSHVASILSKRCAKKVQKFLTNAKFVRDTKIFIYQAKGGLNLV